MTKGLEKLQIYRTHGLGLEFRVISLRPRAGRISRIRAAWFRLRDPTLGIPRRREPVVRIIVIAGHKGSPHLENVHIQLR